MGVGHNQRGDAPVDIQLALNLFVQNAGDDRGRRTATAEQARGFTALFETVIIALAWISVAVVQAAWASAALTLSRLRRPVRGEQDCYSWNQPRSFRQWQPWHAEQPQGICRRLFRR